MSKKFKTGGVVPGAIPLKWPISGEDARGDVSVVIWRKDSEKKHE